MVFIFIFILLFVFGKADLFSVTISPQGQLKLFNFISALFISYQLNARLNYHLIHFSFLSTQQPVHPHYLHHHHPNHTIYCSPPHSNPTKLTTLQNAATHQHGM